MNSNTPRVFIAATRQDEGKTTTSLGLYQTLKKRFNTIGYIKPVGQRFVEVNGLRVDEDSLLMEQTYNVQVPLEDMSPVTVEQHFTRQFLTEGNVAHLEKKIQRSFDRAAWEKEFVIIEGSGHAGVGSIFGLNNARVARLLNSKVVIVTRGGVGAPFDEVTLNLALFEKHGAEVIGVVLNKVLPQKMAMVKEIATMAFEKLGLPVLGVMPRQSLLTRPTVGQVAKEIHGTFLHGENFKRRRVDRIILGAMASRNVAEHFTQRTLVITPGDRDDLILAALLDIVLNGDQSHVAGIVLTGKIEPPAAIMRLMKKTQTPVIVAEPASYDVASIIYGMTVKTEADDKDKIEAIQTLVQDHIDIDRLLALVGSTPPPTT